MKTTLALLLAIFLLSSCTLVSSMEKLVDDAKATVAEVKSIAAATKDQIVEAKAAADTNHDGKTTGSEWATWAAGGGLVTLLGAIVKLFSLQKQTNEIYDATHAPITKLPAGAAAAS